MSDMSGRAIGRYRITEVLGEGGMATVYKAYDTQLQRYVALKIILPVRQTSEKFLRRFRNEARALAQLSHPNIVRIYDYGEHENLPYLVMEYIAGGSLKQVTGRVFPWEDAVFLLIPIADALAYAHEHGIIHRDVKPGNILLSLRGEAMLSDFGIAKLLEAEETLELTGTGVGVGTPEYMAPEQAIGKNVDHRADIYSLGMVLYELLSGKKPFQGNTPFDVLSKKMNEPLPRLRRYVPGVPSTVEAIVRKAMARDQADRFETMQGFHNELQELLTHKQIDSSHTMYLVRQLQSQENQFELLETHDGDGPGFDESHLGELLEHQLNEIDTLQKEIEQQRSLLSAAVTQEKWEAVSRYSREINALEGDLQDVQNLLGSLRVAVDLKTQADLALEQKDLQTAERLAGELRAAGQIGMQIGIHVQQQVDSLREADRQRAEEVIQLTVSAQKAIQSKEWMQVERIIEQLERLTGSGSDEVQEWQRKLNTARQSSMELESQIASLQEKINQAVNAGNWKDAFDLVEQIRLQEQTGSNQSILLQIQSQQVEWQRTQKQELLSQFEKELESLFHAGEWKMALEKLEKLAEVDEKLANGWRERIDTARIAGSQQIIDDRNENAPEEKAVLNNGADKQAITASPKNGWANEPCQAEQISRAGEVKLQPQKRKISLRAWILAVLLGGGGVLLVMMALIPGSWSETGVSAIQMLAAGQSLNVSDTPTQTPEPEITPSVSQTLTPTRIMTATITPSPTVGLIATSISEKDGMVMVYVPAGEFEMGFEGGNDDEKPVHTVYLDAYWIDQTEVTIAMYLHCVESGHCKLPINSSYYHSSDFFDHPAVNIDWFNATAYCEWVGRKLPTEAEWEKAARGIDGRIYPWGNDNPNSNLANYKGNAVDVMSVGSFPSGAGAYGAWDMAGNVWEWVSDWYDGSYFAESLNVNPKGPPSGEYKVLRGGSWFFDESYLRSTYRFRNFPGLTSRQIGFRCAVNAIEGEGVGKNDHSVEPVWELTPTATSIVSPTPDQPIIQISTQVSAKDGMVMVYVPAGEFEMGSDEGNPDEKPVHTVYLDAFWIDQTEVTIDMYLICVNAGICSKQAGFNPYSYLGNHPVVNMRWSQAHEYCEWAGRRLPTEAEWEKAARSTDGRTYPWGEGISCDLANYHGCNGGTIAVGSYPQGASPYGVFDMAGNAWEWVVDYYSTNYYLDSIFRNPIGPATGSMHVLRGGSWLNYEFQLRTTQRLAVNDIGVMDRMGFRCVISE